MEAAADLTLTRSLLNRMVDAITASGDGQSAWPAAELAELAAEVQQTKIWSLSV
ncbi:MAG: hypothetical protein JWP11_116 [Frankiales bacterium]|nr:hypothetical protein [Frankiales bacterium]